MITNETYLRSTKFVRHLLNQIDQFENYSKLSDLKLLKVYLNYFRT